MILIDKQDPLRNDRVGIIDEIYIPSKSSEKKKTLINLFLLVIIMVSFVLPIKKEK